uniref:Uncharacterized protein n=1 Tax=Electrophorus electricus TaxID=8005 RepID=A0A4W4GCX6_ELEEL
MSGSMSSRGCSPDTGAALFNKPTSSSNSEANTDDGSLMEATYSTETGKLRQQMTASDNRNTHYHVRFLHKLG